MSKIIKSHKNLQQLINFHMLIQNNKWIKKQIIEGYYMFNFMIEYENFYDKIKTINIIQKKYNNGLIPVMEVGDDNKLLCIFEGNFIFFDFPDYVTEKEIILYSHQ